MAVVTVDRPWAKPKARLRRRCWRRGPNLYEVKSTDGRYSHFILVHTHDAECLSVECEAKKFGRACWAVRWVLDPRRVESEARRRGVK